MLAVTQIWPPGARYRISSPTQRQAALGAADITAMSVEWEPIGLGTIADLVQHAFGPVDLDRSPVELATVTAVHWGCPACAGGRFGFPGALAEAKAAMCPARLREA